MTTRSQVQFEYGTAAEVAAFTGVSREVVVDIDNWALVIMDGSTAGGKRQASEAYVQAQIATLQAGTIQNIVLASTCI